MTPDPKQFRSITAYYLARAQHEEAVAFWRKFRRFVALAALAVCLILAGINWPGETLACVVVGVPLGIFIKVWCDPAWEAREYSREDEP